MLNKNVLNTLKENRQVLELIKNNENFEVLIKKLSSKEFEDLKLYYPDFIEKNTNSEINIGKLDLNERDLSSILCLTFVKNESKSKKYEKIKKIKIYIDELKEEIIKILEY